VSQRCKQLSVLELFFIYLLQYTTYFILPYSILFTFHLHLLCFIFTATQLFDLFAHIQTRQTFQRLLKFIFKLLFKIILISCVPCAPRTLRCLRGVCGVLAVSIKISPFQCENNFDFLRLRAFENFSTHNFCFFRIKHSPNFNSL